MILQVSRSSYFSAELNLKKNNTSFKNIAKNYLVCDFDQNYLFELKLIWCLWNNLKIFTNSSYVVGQIVFVTS